MSEGHSLVLMQCSCGTKIMYILWAQHLTLGCKNRMKTPSSFLRLVVVYASTVVIAIIRQYYTSHQKWTCPGIRFVWSLPALQFMYNCLSKKFRRVLSRIKMYKSLYKKEFNSSILTSHGGCDMETWRAPAHCLRPGCGARVAPPSLLSAINITVTDNSQVNHAITFCFPFQDRWIYFHRSFERDLCIF